MIDWLFLRNFLIDEISVYNFGREWSLLFFSLLYSHYVLFSRDLLLLLLFFPNELEVKRCSVQFSKWVPVWVWVSGWTFNTISPMIVFHAHLVHLCWWISVETGQVEQERKRTYGGRGGKRSPVLLPIVFDFICRPLLGCME